MAGLGALKRTMGFTIILVFAIFLGLITLISVFFISDPVTTLALSLTGAFFIILLQYLIGPVIVKATSRLHYLAPGENRWLETKVSQMASTTGIPMPRLAVSPDPTPNAFVFGRTHKSAGALIIIAVVAYVVYILTTLLALRLTRLRESYADAYSAYLTKQPRELESALVKIAYGLSLAPGEPHGARAFFIEDPAQAKQDVAQIMDQKSKYDLDHDGVLSERELELAMEAEAKSNWRKAAQLFMTHPPTYKRILMLREIEQEMNTGTFQESNVYDHV